MITLHEIREKAIYLGDGVYFHNDGHSCQIFTTDGISILERIYLDPYVARSLLFRLTEWINDAN